MVASLSGKDAAAIRELMDQKTRGKMPKIPGVIYHAINRNGEEIFSHASGLKGLGTAQPMTLDTIFWLASFTKVITSIACMQMVEQKKLHLDDADIVHQLAPELRDVKVLEKSTNGDYSLVPQERNITLRMLMTHTGKPMPISICALQNSG